MYFACLADDMHMHMMETNFSKKIIKYILFDCKIWNTHWYTFYWGERQTKAGNPYALCNGDTRKNSPKIKTKKSQKIYLLPLYLKMNQA